MLMSEIEELKAELQRFKDMAKKGLDEFKDVGGCWGCGLQLQLNQDMEDIKQLKAENERLKELKCEFKEYCTCNTEKYIQTLQEIKAIANTRFVNGLNKEADIYNAQMDRILDLITKSEEE